ncbi:MAG TPA: hypothetical protein VIH59_29925 [Candidatus Tectomicrobia bacterium]
MREIALGRQAVLDSSYSRFLLANLRSAFERLSREDITFQGLGITLVTGSVGHGLAFPFHVLQAGKPLPAKTLELFGLIYSWVFSTFDRSAALDDSRFLDGDLSSDIDLAMYFQMHPERTREDLANRIRTQLRSQMGFSPRIGIKVRTFDRLTLPKLLSGRCLLGEELAARRFQDLLSRQGPRSVSQASRIATQAIRTNFFKPKHLADLQNRQLGVITDRIVEAILVGVGHGALLLPVSRGKNGWYEKNRHLFATIASGDFEVLELEDAGGALEDQKDPGRDHKFTICRVKGVRTRDKFLPAQRVMLKLRGFPHFKGDLHNKIDLIKEYCAYLAILRALPSDVHWSPAVGPLLLRGDRLVLSNGAGIPTGCIGFVLEEMTLGAGERLFNCRVQHLTDPWTLGKILAHTRSAAAHRGVILDQSSLRDLLAKLVHAFWDAGLSLSYARLGIFYDAAGKVRRLQVFDFERTHFGELTGESHPRLATLVDAESSLAEKGMTTQERLRRLYLSRDHPQGILRMEDTLEVCKFSPWGRQAFLRALRVVRSLCLKLGLPCWSILIRGMIYLSHGLLRARSATSFKLLVLASRSINAYTAYTMLLGTIAGIA